MSADMVLINGRIYSITMDGKQIRGSAVAIRDGIIIKTGSDADIKPFIGKKTRVIDCQQHTILPGLCDAHCHAAWAASMFHSCDLFNVPFEEEDTVEEVIEKYKKRLKKHIQEHPDEELVRGIGWNLAYFSGAAGESRLPTRQDLDQICSDRPVVLESYCQHNIWVNTKALEIAGMDEKTRTPSTGEITREANGYPAGIFSEMSAINLMKENLPGYDFTVQQYKETILRYQKELANRYGVTLIQDALCTENGKQAYRELAQEGALTMRVRGVHAIDRATMQTDLQALKAEKGKYNFTDLYQINTAKLFMEGAFAMCEPFEPEILRTLGKEADYKGTPFWEKDDGADCIAEAMKAGMQIHIHAMGDQSVKRSVECLEKARNLEAGTGRDVIAHVMAVPDDLYEKMGAMNLVCACQPRWAIYDTDVEDFYTPYVGEERARKFFPIGKLTKAGCIVSYGTDFPVTPPPNPFHEIQCAVTRQVFKDAPDYDRFKGKTLGAEDALHDDCVTLEEAIKSLTCNGAYQLFLEETTGTIEKGKSADLAVLNCDLEKVPTEELYNMEVEKTIFKGTVVFDNEVREGDENE